MTELTDTGKSLAVKSHRRLSREGAGSTHAGFGDQDSQPDFFFGAPCFASETIKLQLSSNSATAGTPCRRISVSFNR
jgi:hypothetical protein